MEIALGSIVRITSPDLDDDDAGHADGSVIGMDESGRTVLVEYHGRIETWSMSAVSFDAGLGHWRASGRGEITATL